tara:strand:+ start:515 stop:844 length:330 start_codon:yes stop_codon:yes gene_type:complete
MATYEDRFQGKLWINENKSSQNDPDFKGQLTTVADVQAVTTTREGKKIIDYSAIPSEKKLTVSLWKNMSKDGKAELNIKVAQKSDDGSGPAFKAASTSNSNGNGDDFPF